MRHSCDEAGYIKDLLTLEAYAIAARTMSRARVAGGDVTPEPVEPLTSHQRRQLSVAATLRVVATMAVLVTLYYVMPLDRGVDAAAVVAIVTVFASVGFGDISAVSDGARLLVTVQMLLDLLLLGLVVRLFLSAVTRSQQRQIALSVHEGPR